MDGSRVKPVRDFSGRPDAEQVRNELAAILGSPSFRGSKRCTDLLSYLVEKTLEGKGKSIEEGTLVIEVFGREENGGPADYSIVRVGAREVRKRLAQYYGAEGSHDEVRIELPETSYVPRFRALKTAEVEVAPPVEAEPPAKMVMDKPAEKTREMRPEVRPVVKPAVPLPAAVNKPSTPMVPPVKPIAVPPPARVEVPAARVAPVERAEVTAEAPAAPVTRPRIVDQPAAAQPSEPKRLPWIWIAAGVAALLAVAAGWGWRGMRGGNSEFDQFWGPALQQTAPVKIVLGRRTPQGQVDFGTSSALSLLSQAFGQRARQVEVTEQAGTSSAPDAAVVYLGGLDNASALRWSNDFRFHFADQGGSATIVDSTNGKRWTSKEGDYFLICRVPSGFGVLAGGLTERASAEAGRVLTKADVLAAVLQKLPGDWASRNLEVVLKSAVGNRTPEIVAVQQW